MEQSNRQTGIDLTKTALRDNHQEPVETYDSAQVGDTGAYDRDFASGILDLAPCYLLVTDHHGRLVRTNQACADAMDGARSGIVGRHLWDLDVYHSDGSPARELLARCTTGESPVRVEHRWELPDGSTRHVCWTATMAAGPDGSGKHMIAVGSDITEHVRIEEELRASKERLALAQAVAGIGTWDWDVRSDGCTYSQNCVSLYGLSPGQSLGSMADWSELVHPDDRERLAGEVATAMAGGEYANSEYRILWPDGTVRWLVCKARVFRDASGHPIRVIGANYDITERKLAVEDLRRDYEREKAIAGTLQDAMLPSINVSVQGFDIAGLYKPAMAEAEVGGDFYDLFTLPDGRLAFVVGDVSGKGLQAAVYTAMAKYMLRAYADGRPDPAVVMRKLNRAMYDYTTDEMFTALVYGILDPATRTVIYANAGHDKPLLYDSIRREVAPLEVTGPITGIKRDCTYEVCSLQMRPGDFLLLYTDGITDARNAQGFFDIEGLSQVVSANACQSAERIVQAAYEAALSHADGDLGDDAAILVLRATQEESGDTGP